MMTLKPPTSQPLLLQVPQKKQLRLSTIHNPSPPGKPFCQAIHLSLGQTKSPCLHQHTNKHLLNCTFSKSVNNNQANVTEPYNQGIKVQIAAKDIKKGRFCMKSPPPEAQCAEWCFSNPTLYFPIFPVLTFQIIYQYPRSGST